MTREEIKELTGRLKTNEEVKSFLASKTAEEREEIKKAFKAFSSTATEEEFAEVMNALGEEGRKTVKENLSAADLSVDVVDVCINAIDKAITKQ